MLGIDEELTQAGDNGRYQQLLLWLVFLPTQLPFGSQHYFQLLGSWTPDHWCKVSRVPPDDVSLYWSLRVAMVKEYKNTDFLHAQCFVNRSLNTAVISEQRKIMKKRFMSYRTSNMISKCDHGWYYNRSSLGDSNTIVTEWDLVCDRSWLPTFAFMFYGIGEFLSLPLYFYVSYRQGRRFSFFLFLACECLFGAITSLAPNIGCFIILRFLLGLTVPASVATPAALAQELVGTKWRGRNLHLVYLYRSLGGVLLAGSVFVIRDWPQIALASTVPFVAFFLYWWQTGSKGHLFANDLKTVLQNDPLPHGETLKRRIQKNAAWLSAVPESPQWLLARGRFEETIRLVRTIASNNSRDLTPDFIVATKRKFVLERSLREHKNEPKTQKEATKELFRAQGLRKRTIVLIFSWFTSTASFLGLNYLCIELEGDVHYNVLWSAVAEVLGWIVAAILLKCTAPRRCSNCVICAVGGVLCISLAIGRRGKSSSASLTLYVSTKLTVSISYFVFPLWTAEILPPGPRETALVLAEILNLACPVFLPLLIYQGRTQHLLPMTLLGLLHVAGGLMSLCLPETRLISFLNTPAVVPVAQCDGHWTAHNCAHCHNSPNCTPRNSLRNPNPLPESPIFSLLRCQESQMSYSGRESAMSDMSNPRLGERQLSMDELKVTVL